MSQPLKSLTNTLFVKLQYLVPSRMLGRLTYRISRSRRPWLKNMLIRIFVRLYAVDTSEMDRPAPCDYPSLNAFFTRSLQAGARPVDADPLAICSPADGTVQQVGRIRQGQLIQAKGINYSLAGLLGIDDGAAGRFNNGGFLTIYLAPQDYHRVHMPLDGSVRSMRYLPGKRLAVNKRTADSVPGLFAGNERLSCCCEGPRGPFWLVFVGAMNVASVSTAWSGETLPVSNGGRFRQDYADQHVPKLNKGDYCGHFNMGSTVIIALPPDTVNWDPALTPGTKVRVGQRVGILTADQAGSA